MSNRTTPVLPKWPFFAGDVLLLVVAVYVATQSPHPLMLLQDVLCVGAVALGAILAVLPFLFEYRAAAKFIEIGQLADTVAQIQKLERLAAQISDATARWQEVHTAADKTATSAKEITERMADEVKGFTEFMRKANDSEKATLHLEVEKARRAEGDWLQLVVRILDHIFALHQAAVRSGQPELVAQLDSFQNACRDVARRIGLTPFAAEADEPFDADRHKVFDNETASAGALIGETLAAGYNYQGRLLRPALVKLKSSETPAAASGEKAVTDTEQSLL